MSDEERKAIENLKMDNDDYLKQDRELFLTAFKEGKIILTDVEADKEGNTTYYYIQKIC